MPSSPTDKVVILARGLGTRMQCPDPSAPLDDQQAVVAETGRKALIPIGRPFLDYVLSSLAGAGYRRVCLVVGPGRDPLRDYYSRQVQARVLRLEFAVQETPRGTADAVLAAEPFAATEPFVMINSDNYYPPEALRALRDEDGCAVALFQWQGMLSGNIAEERLRRFAVGCVDDHGYLQRILEKPDAQTWDSLPRPLWVSMNCWRFEPSIFEGCRAIGPSPRGELEITDAVQYAIDVLGQRFHVVKVLSPVLDLSSRQDVAPIAAKLGGMEVAF